MNFEKEIAFCSEKVCPDLSSLHYATLFKSPEEKAFWLGCMTLSHEIRRATLQQVEAGLTQVKLGWWQSALASSKQHQAQHPVILAIGQDVVNRVEDETWAILINHGVEACEPKRYDNFDVWTSDLQKILMPWEHVIHAKFDLSDVAEITMFWAHSTQLTQILRMAKYLEQNFQPIPIDELAKHQVTADSLRKREVNDNTQQLFKSLTTRIVQLAQTRWEKLSPATRLTVRPLRTLYLLRLAELKQHRKENFRHILTEQKTLSPGKKFWLSWAVQVLRR
jgi:15-cis-phytoene synthase